MGVSSRDTIFFQSALISAPEAGSVVLKGEGKKSSLSELALAGKHSVALTGYEAFLHTLPFPKETLPETKVFVIPRRAEAELSMNFKDGAEIAALSLFVIVEEDAKLFITSEIGGGRCSPTLLFAHCFVAAGAEAVFAEANTSRASESASFLSAEVSHGAAARFWNLSSSESFVFVRHRTRLAGKGARVSDSVLVSEGGEGVVDVFSSVEHAAPDTVSKIFSRAAIGGKAKGVLQSNIHICKGARGSEGREDMKALLLSDGAEADPIPHLEVEEEDVKCSHGASVARLRDEALLACALRGMEEGEAKKLLLEGFFEQGIHSASSNVQEFLHPKIAETLQTIV